MDIGQIGSTAKATARIDTQAASVTSPANSAVKEKPAPAMTPNAIQQPNAAPSQSQVDQALHSINKALQTLAPNLEFTQDEDSKRTIVKVVDQQTKEVIRQMPSVEAVEISKAMDKLQGLLVRQKA